MLNFENPLNWPESQATTPRSRQNNLHGFPPTLTVEDACRFLEEEVAHFQPINAILSTHIPHFNSPRLRKTENISSAMALELILPDARYLLACDRWLFPQHNVYAIMLTLRTFRQLDGWGTAPLEALLALYRVKARQVEQALPPELANLEPWRLALGLGPNATLNDANATYRARAKLIGDHDETRLAELNNAIEQARRALPDA